MATSNPLPPPPPRRKVEPGSQSVRQENLSNADFRRMVMETPRRVPEESTRERNKKKHDETPRRAPRKYRPPKPKEEEKKSEEEDTPKYRDRAKERREDQNPDYEAGINLQAVAPPGAIDLHTTDLQKISIANSKYLGGDVEHTHLVKGLDYALLNKVRSEMKKQPEDVDSEEEPKPRKEEETLTFRTPAAKWIYRWIVKPPIVNPISEMFLPGRMAFAYDMEEMTHHIPTTVYRSKDDCPPPEEYVSVAVDQAVLDRITRIMQYLKLGSSGKILKKKKKEKGAKVNTVTEEKAEQKIEIEPQKQEQNQQEEASKPRDTEDDIFEDAGTDYVATAANTDTDRLSEDMEESPREDPQWEQAPVQGPTMPQINGDWQEYPSAESWPAEYTYAEQYYNTEYVLDAQTMDSKDPRFMSQEEKDRGLGSVFKRDDQRLRQRRELDAREKDPNFVSESYSECYPGYQEYNREIVDSDEEEDLTKMDMGGRTKGRLHRWDFETEEEWSKYNDQKEAMPKAAFQFGVKMQDGRKTRKQNKEQKLTNELHKITQIIEKKKREKGGGGGLDEDLSVESDNHPNKRVRV